MIYSHLWNWKPQKTFIHFASSDQKFLILFFIVWNLSISIGHKYCSRKRYFIGLRSGRLRGGRSNGKNNSVENQVVCFWFVVSFCLLHVQQNHRSVFFLPYLLSNNKYTLKCISTVDHQSFQSVSGGEGGYLLRNYANRRKNPIDANLYVGCSTAQYSIIIFSSPSTKGKIGRFGSVQFSEKQKSKTCKS